MYIVFLQLEEVDIVDCYYEDVTSDRILLRHGCGWGAP